MMVDGCGRKPFGRCCSQPAFFGIQGGPRRFVPAHISAKSLAQSISVKETRQIDTESSAKGRIAYAKHP